jgi:hypothetical protein
LGNDIPEALAKLRIIHMLSMSRETRHVFDHVEVGVAQDSKECVVMLSACGVEKV